MDLNLTLNELLALAEAPPPRDDDVVVAEPEPWIHQYAALMLTRAVMGSPSFWDDVERQRVGRLPAAEAPAPSQAPHSESDATRRTYFALLATAATFPDDDAAKLALHTRLLAAEPEWVPESEPPLALERSLEAIDAITGGVALVARTAFHRCWFHTTVPPTERRETEWCPERAHEESRYCARHEGDYEHNDFARRAARLRSVERVFQYAEPAILATFPTVDAVQDAREPDELRNAG